MPDWYMDGDPFRHHAMRVRHLRPRPGEPGWGYEFEFPRRLGLLFRGHWDGSGPWELSTRPFRFLVSDQALLDYYRVYVDTLTGAGERFDTRVMTCADLPFHEPTGECPDIHGDDEFVVEETGNHVHLSLPPGRFTFRVVLWCTAWLGFLLAGHGDWYGNYWFREHWTMWASPPPPNAYEFADRRYWAVTPNPPRRNKPFTWEVRISETMPWMIHTWANLTYLVWERTREAGVEPDFVEPEVFIQFIPPWGRSSSIFERRRPGTQYDLLREIREELGHRFDPVTRRVVDFILEHKWIPLHPQDFFHVFPNGRL